MAKKDTSFLILRTAHKLYQAGGDRAASIRNIAACVGIAPSTVYKHYRNKAELLDRVALEEVRSVRHRMPDSRYRHPPRMLMKLVEQLTAYSRSEPHLFQLIRDRKIDETPIDVLAYPMDCMNRNRRSLHRDYSRSVWGLIVGMASPHSFGGVADARFQLTRVFQLANVAMPLVWLPLRRWDHRRHVSPFASAA